MAIKLNHTIVHSRDKREAAEFFSELFNRPEPVFVACFTEGVEGGLIKERAGVVGHHARGADVVLVVVANAQGGVGDGQFPRRLGLDEYS